MSLEITIGNRRIGAKHPPYIIAELSANHNGSIERALQTIKLAKDCGADAVKLQTYTPDTMTIDSDRAEFHIKGGLWDGYSLYDLYKLAQTPYDWHAKMFSYARSIGITIFSTPFDETAVDLLEALDAPAYKIASFEATDLPLVRYAASKGKPMIISTGMASEDEIEEVVSCAREAGCRDVILLHCISSYPTPIDQANVLQVAELGRRFGVVPGLSDHTLGTTVSVAAVAVGASVIEKHFTISRADKGADSEFSLEPHELNSLCTSAKDAWAALGSVGFERKEAEKDNRTFRRSIYFVKDLPSGAVVEADHIQRIRPGFGLPPKHFDDLIGRRLNRAVSKGEPTSWDHFT